MSPLPPSRPPFSAGDAAFAGFRLARREPLTILVWSVLSLAVMVVTGALLVGTAGPQILAFQNEVAAHPGVVDPQRSLAMMQSLAPFYGVTLLGSLAFMGVLVAAVDRAVLRAQGRPGRLALGVDELLQVAVAIGLGVALGVLYMAGVLAAVLVGVMVAIASRPAGVIVGVLATLAVAGGLVFVAVRLSLLGPLVFDRRRFDVAEAWRLTRGRFWALLGAYLLAMLLVLVVSLAAMLLFAVVVTPLAGMQAAGVMFKPDLSSVGAYFSVAMVTWLLIGALLNGLLYAVLLAAPADAYRQLAGAAPGTASGVTSAPVTASDRSTAFGARV